jgi:hypothetical protein
MQGRINLRVKSMDGVKFEIISHPKYGRVGWNNSVSGEFTYSPRQYTLETTNHGREAERAHQIPGCEDKCSGGATGDCPNKDASKGPVATPHQIKMVEDEEVGFPCTEHWAPVDLDYFRFRGACTCTLCVAAFNLPGPVFRHGGNICCCPCVASVRSCQRVWHVQLG